MTTMSGSEAMLEALRLEGVTAIPGIVGSGFMDPLDLFPQAGIRFLGVRHEQTAAHMADAYARVSGHAGVCIAQNGPGVTNMVTGIATAYLAHSPVVLITPSVTSSTSGNDGFQETDQLAVFAKITKHQIRMNRPDRILEAFRTAFRIAYADRGPVQVDIPRDYFYGVFDAEVLPPGRYRYSSRVEGPTEALEAAARLLNEARFPVIVAGLGAVESEATGEIAALAEELSAPVVTSYMHNDAFPGDHPLAAGPIGYQGSKAAMRLLGYADVVLGIGTRFGSFGTLPAYGIDYFPRDARLIQIDIDSRQLGRHRAINVGIAGDARLATSSILRRLREVDHSRPKDEDRLKLIEGEKTAWSDELRAMSSSGEVPISPRRGLMEVRNALPNDAIVVTDIGNITAVASAYLQFTRPRSYLAAGSYAGCGFGYGAALGAKLAQPDRPVVALIGDGAWTMLGMAEVLSAVENDIPVVAVINNNQQWGAEKRNQVDFYGKRFIGTNLVEPNFAGIAELMGAHASQVEKPGDIESSVKEAIRADRPAVVEIKVSRELSEPFRRDALKVPERYLPRYKEVAPPGS